jgi:hypothetical protein
MGIVYSVAKRKEITLPKDMDTHEIDITPIDTSFVTNIELSNLTAKKTTK